MTRYRRRAAECTAAGRRSASPEEQALWFKLSDDWLALAGEVAERVDYWTDRARAARTAEVERHKGIHIAFSAKLKVIAFEPSVRPVRVPLFTPPPAEKSTTAAVPEARLATPPQAVAAEPKHAPVSLPYLPAAATPPSAALPYLPATIAPAKRALRAWPDPNVRIVKNLPAAHG